MQDDVKCPCCGQQTPPTKVHVNLDWNALYRGDREVGLTQQEAELAFILVRRMPGVVERDTMVRQLWGNQEPNNARTHVNVVIYRLRKKLRRVSIDIVNHWNQGFSMAVRPLPRTERTSGFSTVTGEDYAQA